MYLIVGLGNPTPPYQYHRHNAGFLAIDYLLRSQLHTAINKSAFQGDLFKTKHKLWLKPSTYMNLSGQSVSAVLNFYKVDITHTIVIYDDMDIPFGSLKFKIGGADAGHNGLKSINSYCPNRYMKIKIGIGKPIHKAQVNSFVLSDFTTDELGHLQDRIFPTIDKAVDSIKQTPFAQIASLYTLKPKLTDD